MRVVLADVLSTLFLRLYYGSINRSLKQKRLKTSTMAKFDKSKVKCTSINKYRVAMDWIFNIIIIYKYFE